MCYLPSKFRCHGLYILGATEGGGKSGISPHPPGRRRPKKARSKGLCSIYQVHIYTIVSFYCVKSIVSLFKG